MFLEATRSSEPLRLHMTTPHTTTNVSITSPTWYSPFAINIDAVVEPGDVTIVDLPVELRLLGNEVNNKVLRVAADTEIAVHAGDIQGNTGDIHLVYPVENLGTEYVIVSLDNGTGSLFGIAATADNTLIKIYPPLGVELSLEGINYTGPFYMTLNYYQVVQFNAPRVTGIVIMADKPIAVSSGHAIQQNIAMGGYSWDHMEEQLVPVSAWSQEYIVVSSYTCSSCGETVLIVAFYSNTTVTISSATTTTVTLVEMGDFTEFFVTANDSLIISGDQPFSVLQFGVSQSGTEHKSDVYMLQVPGTNEYLHQITFPSFSPTPHDPDLTSKAVVVANSQASSSMYINGQLLTSDWSQVGATTYYYTHIDLSNFSASYTLQTTHFGGRFGGFVTAIADKMQVATALGRYFVSQLVKLHRIVHF